MILTSIVNIAKICAAQGVQHVVLSPGSRCAPLTLAFVRHPRIAVKTLSDERSAAFVALGMARQTRQTVGLVCTSGSAAYNYAPAVAEAYFQQIPLLVFTADRPPEWIDQLDGQTIRQQDIYGKHVQGSYTLPVGQTEADLWYAGRMVSEAINLSRSYPSGPVHVNVPVREPFYPQEDESMDFTSPIKVITQVPATPRLVPDSVASLARELAYYQRPLIVCGQQAYDTQLLSTLTQFSEQHRIPVVADVISNLHELPGAVKHADVLLGKNDATFKETLQPDLLMTVGLSVMSKNLKTFLRTHRPQAHWHIQPAGAAADTFQCLTRVVHSDPVAFFADMLARPEGKDRSEVFANQWRQAEATTASWMQQLFEAEKVQARSEFAVVWQTLQSLPANISLHLANSMTVRYANLTGLHHAQQNTEVFANRGTSGIDGSNSTAVGGALASDRCTLLITGDMAFFYDRNAFWHNYRLPQLRILLLNNRGGGIFRMIEEPARQPESDEYFVTHQALLAENTARDFGMSYERIDNTAGGGRSTIQDALARFWQDDAPHAKLLEIVTDAKINTENFRQYKELLQQLNV